MRTLFTLSFLESYAATSVDLLTYDSSLFIAKLTPEFATRYTVSLLSVLTYHEFSPSYFIPIRQVISSALLSLNVILTVAVGLSKPYFARSVAFSSTICFAPMPPALLIAVEYALLFASASGIESMPHFSLPKRFIVYSPLSLLIVSVEISSVV